VSKSIRPATPAPHTGLAEHPSDLGAGGPGHERKHLTLFDYSSILPSLSKVKAVLNMQQNRHLLLCPAHGQEEGHLHLTMSAKQLFELSTENINGYQATKRPNFNVKPTIPELPTAS
jgi:hypothetical protein